MALRYICAVMVILLLSHCSSSPSKTQSDSRAPVDSSAATERSAEQLIALANSQSSPLAEQTLLQAIALLQQQQRFAQAREVLGQIFQNYLTQELWQQYQIALVRDAIAQQDGEGALSLLAELDINLPEYQAWYADALALNGRLFDATVIRMQLSTDTQQQADWQNIWDVLQQLSPGQLALAIQRFEQPVVQGWLELAQLFNQQHTDIHRQGIALNEWRLRWPNHPANLQLPMAVNAVKQSSINSPQSVALLLPLSGAAATSGQAVRDGFTATLLSAANNQNPVPQVFYFDTNSGDISLLYQQAIDSGAKLIIGPLRKDKLQQLTRQTTFTVPTLALNQIDVDAAISNLYQFSLAPEDEVQQMAKLASQQGWKNALVFYPDNSLGLRAKAAFDQQWQELGGTIVEAQALGDPKSYSRTIMETLQIDHSNQRAADLQKLLRTKMAFEPRRRQDIDFIFLYANANQAQAIKPFLKYHYAAELPVYATSRIYNGPNYKGNSDLDGIWFCDMPWQFGQDEVLKSNITHAWPDAQGNLGRLYALGVDAYRLHSRLTLWQENPLMQIYGVTGVLSKSASGQIHRRSAYAVMRNGKAQALPAVIDDSPLLSSANAQP